MLKRANAFCEKSDKSMIPVEEHIIKPPYMINHYPNVTLTFVCKSKQNKKLKQTEKKVTQKLESSREVSSKYNDLMMLKKLLDDKILTPKEFAVEKKKILER